MRTSFATLFAVSGLVASTLAFPAYDMAKRQAPICSSGTPLCCDVDVLGVADLNCEAPESTPTTVGEFVDICAAVGKIDMCCLIPILEQGLLCSSPS